MKNEQKFPKVDLWRDDDGFIANGHGDDYQTFADTNVNDLDIDDRERNTEFIITACNSYHDMYEALKEIEQFLTSYEIFDRNGRNMYEDISDTFEIIQAALSKANPQSV